MGAPVYVRALTTVSCGCVYVINANGHKKIATTPQPCALYSTSRGSVWL